MSIIKLNAGYRFPYYLESLTFLIGWPVVRTDGRTDGHVITKISRIMELHSRAILTFVWSVTRGGGGGGNNKQINSVLHFTLHYVTQI